MNFSQVIYSGENYYQLFWKDRGYKIKSGQSTPLLPIQECLRLMGTGFFTASHDTWNQIIAGKENNQYDSVEGLLKGQRCFILGGGPSLKGFDINRLDNEFTIAVNHSFEFYPKARSIIFVDTLYADLNRERIEKYTGLVFASFRCQERLPKKDNIMIFPQNNTRPGARISEGLYSGRLTALAAINLALIMLADEIYLLGFDMCYSGPDHHWYGTAHPNQETYKEENLTKKIVMFDMFKKWNDRIFNCSPISKIKTFEFRDIERVLTNIEPVKTKKNFFIQEPKREIQTKTNVYPTSSVLKLSQINGMLHGNRVFVLGSGTSIKGFDFHRLDNEETIAVNHTFEYYQAKHHLFGDPGVLSFVWEKYKGYNGNIFTSYHTNFGDFEYKSNVFVFAKVNKVTERLEEGLYSDFNSGMEAVNLALIMGASQIFLLGMDFCADKNEYYFYGKPKWFKSSVQHCDKVLGDRVKYWDNFLPYKNRIFNCSSISRIKIFKFANIDEVLSGKFVA